MKDVNEDLYQPVKMSSPKNHIAHLYSIVLYTLQYGLYLVRLQKKT